MINRSRNNATLAEFQKSILDNYQFSLTDLGMKSRYGRYSRQFKHKTEAAYYLGLSSAEVIEQVALQHNRLRPSYFE